MVKGGLSRHLFKKKTSAQIVDNRSLARAIETERFKAYPGVTNVESFGRALWLFVAGDDFDDNGDYHDAK